ncbi:MAG: hypothetical protein IPH56_02525 [Chitinophagaceae bacterium]|nr:hypothetical protein [Chitinophagaceae bacterium]
MEFHFWGPDSLKENNVSGLSEASQQHLDFLQFLKKSVSVVLHGVKAINELAEEMQAMDAFIFCTLLKLISMLLPIHTKFWSI